MKEKVMVFGSFVVDLMSRADHLPKPGETVRGTEFNTGPGGKGFNQAVAAHKSGADIVVVTKIGNDPFGQIALDIAENIGMDKSGIIFSKEDLTGAALICVDEKTAENQILIVPGACNTIKKEEIDSIDDI
ncbi:PfkB family carbohydrate kinase [Peptoniphilus asaccharolyticus]